MSDAISRWAAFSIALEREIKPFLRIGTASSDVNPVFRSKEEREYVRALEVCEEKMRSYYRSQGIAGAHHT